MAGNIHITTFESEVDLTAEVAKQLRAELQKAGSAPHLILLSGGRTPLPVYDYLARHPFALSKTAHIGYSDDRHVPAEAAESNYGSTRPMLAALGATDEQVLRVHTELPLAEAAEHYDKRLRAFLQSGGTITLAFLGLGADGHTCSLFTPEDLERAQGHLAIPVERPAPPHRVSVTPELLAHVERVVVLVAGEEKELVVRDLLKAPQRLVAGRALAHAKNVELWRA
jgi:6-phosphogluconolactonase